MTVFNSSHPAELSLKLAIIFCGFLISHRYQIKAFINSMTDIFRGIFMRPGNIFARFEPTLTKSLLNVSEICFPFVIEMPLDLNSEAEGLYLHLLIIDFII